MKRPISDKFRQNFGKRVAAARRAHGTPQSAVAEALGLSKNSIAAIENGRQLPALDLLRPLADELGVNIDDLFPPA